MAMFHFFPRQARALPPTTRPSRRQGAQRRAWAPPSAPPALVLTRTCPGAPRRSLLGEAESLAGRAVAAMVGGVVTALVGCPFDVPEAAPRTPARRAPPRRRLSPRPSEPRTCHLWLQVLKTRLMNQDARRPLYTGPADAFVRIVRVEGPLALYKGLLPVYLRQVRWPRRPSRPAPLALPATSCPTCTRPASCRRRSTSSTTSSWNSLRPRFWGGRCEDKVLSFLIEFGAR
jgi:hypothetical protein